MGLPENLRVIRKNRGLAQKNISEKMEVAVSTVAMWETGARQPKAKTLKKLAKVLDVTVDQLVQEESLVGDGWLPESEFQQRVSAQTRENNFDLSEIRDLLRSRPEMKMLFSVSKGASKADIERTVAIIEGLKNGRR